MMGLVSWPPIPVLWPCWAVASAHAPGSAQAWSAEQQGYWCSGEGRKEGGGREGEGEGGGKEEGGGRREGREEWGDGERNGG